MLKVEEKRFSHWGPLAVEVLKWNIGNRTEGYVFTNPKTGDRYYSIHKGFNNAVRKLGLSVNETKLRFHDLRHLHATWLHKAGVSLDVIRPLLGQRDRETTDRYVTYDRLSYGNVLKAIPRINKKTEKETPDFQLSKSLSSKMARIGKVTIQNTCFPCQRKL